MLQERASGFFICAENAWITIRAIMFSMQKCAVFDFILVIEDRKGMPDGR